MRLFAAQRFTIVPDSELRGRRALPAARSFTCREEPSNLGGAGAAGCSRSRRRRSTTYAACAHREFASGSRDLTSSSCVHCGWSRSPQGHLGACEPGRLGYPAAPVVVVSRHPAGIVTDVEAPCEEARAIAARLWTSRPTVW